MNNKNYNSYLVIGVIVLVVLFLFVFNLFNNREDPMANNQEYDGQLTFVDDSGEETEGEDETEPTINTDLSDEQMLGTLLTDFNNAWINYVNDDALAVFDFVNDDSEIRYDVMVFDTVGVTEELLDMRIDDVTVEGDMAYITDYEKFKKVENGVETIVEYNWVYTAKKVDGIWLLDSFQPAN